MIAPSGFPFNNLNHKELTESKCQTRYNAQMCYLQFWANMCPSLCCPAPALGPTHPKNKVVLGIKK